MVVLRVLVGVAVGAVALLLPHTVRAVLQLFAKIWMIDTSSGG